MSQSSSRPPWILAVSWRGAGKASLPSDAREFGSYRNRRTITFGRPLRVFRLAGSRLLACFGWPNFAEPCFSEVDSSPVLLT
jgi:hypothetical protein